MISFISDPPTSYQSRQLPPSPPGCFFSLRDLYLSQFIEESSDAQSVLDLPLPDALHLLWKFIPILQRLPQCLRRQIKIYTKNQKFNQFLD